MALHQPLDAAAHVAFADGFRSRSAGLFEAVELRIATTLDPRRTPDRLRLGRALAAIGLKGTARRELESLLATAPDTPEARAAHVLIREIGQAPDRNLEPEMVDPGPR